MKSIRGTRPTVFVLSAGAVLVGLAALLVVRVASGARPEAPRAAVPPPRLVEAATLTVPCWSCEETRTTWPIRFRTDLGTLVDFFLCLVAFGVIKTAALWRERSRPPRT